MRILLLSALFAFGVGLAGTSGASAAAGSSAINDAAKSTSLLTQAACRRVTVCRRGPNGRRVCVVERVCR
jgi:hypothetical protein